MLQTSPPTPLGTRLAPLAPRLAREASPEVQDAALAAPTAAGSLALLLAEHAATEAVRRLDPLAAATARAAAARVALVEESGGFLTAEDAARLLGLTRQALDKRRAARRVLGLRVAGDWRYPAAQFEGNDVVPGLDLVLAAMADAGPWAALDALLAPDAALSDRSPLAALRAGEREAVRRWAAAIEADAPG